MQNKPAVIAVLVIVIVIAVALVATQVMKKGGPKSRVDQKTGQDLLKPLEGPAPGKAMPEPPRPEGGMGQAPVPPVTK